MESFTPELLEKARTAKSAEELLTLAKDNGIEDFTEESAKAYFELLHPASGEVADDELESVTGGGCYNGGELIVTLGKASCDVYECKHCKKTWTQLDDEDLLAEWNCSHNCNRRLTRANICGTCKYCKYKSGLWKCTNPEKRK